MNILYYPPSIDWELTASCNHNCIHCYNFWRTKKKSSFVEKDSDYYIKCAQRIIDSKPVSVQITGGEPLLVWEKARPALQLLLDAGICVSINTNATMVTPEIASFLAKNKVDAFISFPCSRKEIFDSIVNCPGAYERAVSGISLLIDSGVRTSLNMVVTKLNLDYVYESAVFVHDRFHQTYFSATKASFPQNADAEFRTQMLSLDEFNGMLKTLIRVKRELNMRVDSAWVYSMCGFDCRELEQQFGFHRKCGCGRYNFVLDSNGNMKACGCEDTTYGNIFEKSFSESIAKMSVWQNASLLPEECRKCPVLKYCGGGCRSDAYSTNGRYCALDSTAESKRLMMRYADATPENAAERTWILRCNENAVFVQENGFVRVSLRSNYEFISNAAAAFLKSYPHFSVSQLLEACSNPSEVVQFWLWKMIGKKILVRVDNADDVSPTCNKTSFSLSASPYVSWESPQYVLDYASADNNAKRFM